MSESVVIKYGKQAHVCVSPRRAGDARVVACQVRTAAHPDSACSVGYIGVLFEVVSARTEAN